MDTVHAGISHVGREVGASIAGAAKQFAKELVQMGQEEAVLVSVVVCDHVQPRLTIDCLCYRWQAYSSSKVLHHLHQGSSRWQGDCPRW